MPLNSPDNNKSNYRAQLAASRRLGSKLSSATSGVVVYTIPNCPACDAVKALLNTQGVDYTVTMATEDESFRELAKSVTEPGVGIIFPITIINGTPVVGNNQPALLLALAR